MKHGGRFIDRTGHKYGKLTVVAFAGKNQRNQSNWFCSCDCGVECVVFSGNLHSGHTTSCGCAKANANFKHGEGGGKNFVTRSPEYQTLASILQRCLNPKSESYQRYGAKGITVCEQWNSMTKFPAFLAHVGRRPSMDHSIDRWPNKNGNYEPGNVRWATDAEQSRNKVNNINVTVDGVTLCLKDMADKYGISDSAAKDRLEKGWPTEAAFKIPPSKRHQTTLGKCLS